MNKKGILQDRLFLAMVVLVFGGVGILIWSYGIASNLSSASWIGKIILTVIGLLVLIIERFLK